MSSSSATAQQIARGLLLAGVREVVFAPGSRSAPLVYALAPLAEAGLLRTHMRIDERDAAFLALGLARGLRVRGEESPVVVVTTSGSAVANLHPAVLEASYSHLPLLALTADRPARLRGTGANQTIDDQSLVLSDVRGRFDVPASGNVEAPTAEAFVTEPLAEALALCLGTESVPGDDRVGTTVRPPGPVQFNVQLDVPLVPTPAEVEAWEAEIGGELTAGTLQLGAGASARQARVDRDVVAGFGDSLDIVPGTVIVAGDAGGHSADALERFARAHGLPILAEPGSMLTASVNAVRSHARVLGTREDLRESIRQVLVHGKPTLSRPVAALLADESVQIIGLPERIDANPGPPATDSSKADDIVGTGGRVDGVDADWLDRWIAAGEWEVPVTVPGEGEFARGSIEAQSPSALPLPDQILGDLIDRPIELFAASSNSIRYLATVLRPGHAARIHASRGLAGIDGLVSTAAGLSLSVDDEVVLVIGDIATLHDIGGLLTPSLEEKARLCIVVLNDDGGTIFSGLEHSQPQVSRYLERYFTVPHGRHFGQYAEAAGLDYDSVDSVDAFVRAFERRSGNPQRLIEVALG